MSEGRKRLAEYNREHDVRIEINKEVTQKMGDERNLGWYLIKIGRTKLFAYAVLGCCCVGR